ncbi:FUSC family protein [Streptoalloteichus tenebrarius]|uniref:FUSC family protein n=1 Tax=Streptoalloteichus tenebrarius (strain ATCC 17920 / DSM 40477 / JCM 4838 / CBS 697.72 / NBRC 16177 / NCIMB 11028 / NRRL B-12390 / A12253. 1 / ISP 5477) TaxID=1933 RepID=UPI0020A53AFD|nr:FUSC family protein [Streptoalloteichus tenebrarius]
MREEVRRRLRRLARTALPILQCAIAAGLAWVVAKDLVGHARPFFAPIAGVVVLGVSLGQRLRRVVELVVGVSVGIGVGDLLISMIGSGPWQIALVVALAMSTAVLLDSGTVIALQSGSSAVLVATLLPPGDSAGVNRMVDALIGGLIGLGVAALIPANPITVAHRQGRAVFGELALALRGAASAVEDRDPARAAAALTRARGSQKALEDFRAALETGSEIATIAPIRWRRRSELEHYRSAAAPIDYAMRNTRVLLRRTIAALRDGESVPERLPEVLRALADATERLRDELARGDEPVHARRVALEAGRAATADLLTDGGFSMRVVVAQLRSIVVDLLQATGVGREDASAALPAMGARRPEK